MDRAGVTFKIFRWTLVTMIVMESAMTLVQSLHSTTESHLGAILPYFAGLEAIAALMLLTLKTLKIGGIILLIIFALALIIHGPAEQLHLFVYAAGVIFLIAHP